MRLVQFQIQLVDKVNNLNKLNTSVEIKNKIDSIYTTFDDLVALNKEAKQELSNLDRELSSQYHVIEGVALEYMSDSHLLITKLRDILFRRRESKLKNTMLESFVNSMEPVINKSKKRNEDIIQKHNEIIDEIITRAK
jgi:hypothetical protein